MRKRYNTPRSTTRTAVAWGILFCCLALRAGAQQELLLHSMPDLWQSNSLNPAFFPQGKKVAVGVAAFTLDAYHSNKLTYSDLFVKNGDKTVIDFGNAIAQLDPENSVFLDQRIETIQFGLRLPGNWAIQLGHANRLTGKIDYPKSLAELLWYGNAPYIGETVEFGVKANVFDWNEWSAGLSKQIGPVSVGARLKLLSGISALQTDPDHARMSVYTDPDIYQMTLQTDYSVHSSSIISAIDTSDLGFDLALADLNKRRLFSKNKGVALDLGIQWRLLGNKLTLDAGVLDLGGQIGWKDEAYLFQSKATYRYEGTSIPGKDILDGKTDLDFDTKLDTLNDIFRFNKSADAFDTQIPLRLYAGGSFNLNRHWTVGLTLFHQRTEEQQRTAAGVNLRWNPLRWVALNAMLNANEQFSALGFGLSLTPGPVQVYFLSDNLFNAFSLKNTPAVNFRLGAGLVF